MFMRGSLLIVTQINVDVSSMRPLLLFGKRSHTSHQLKLTSLTVYNWSLATWLIQEEWRLSISEYVLHWLQWAVLPSFSGPQPQRKQLTGLSDDWEHKQYQFLCHHSYGEKQSLFKIPMNRELSLLCCHLMCFLSPGFFPPLKWERGR